MCHRQLAHYKTANLGHVVQVSLRKLYPFALFLLWLLAAVVLWQNVFQDGEKSLELGFWTAFKDVL